MKYKDAIKLSMNEFAKDEKAMFLGYNTKMANQALGTLTDVPKDKIIETPLAENLMAGLSIGLSLSGYKPILYFERFDFILNALDAIVNHLDKIDKIYKSVDFINLAKKLGTFNKSRQIYISGYIRFYIENISGDIKEIFKKKNKLEINSEDIFGLY